MIKSMIKRFTMHIQSYSAGRTSAWLALAGADRKRLERLAAAAGSTPQRMLKFVLRDGFAYCEEFVRRVNAGIASARRGEIVSDSEARVELRAMAARHGRRSRKAA
jgi:predicted transcriptional regulator